jgi:hypothetical protein
MNIEPVRCGLRKILLTIGAAAFCTSILAAADARTPVTLTGCVNPGTDDNAYVLTNVREVAHGESRVPEILYWIASIDKLKGHLGHMVEVHGSYSLDRDEGKTGKVKVETDAKKGTEKLVLENGAKKAEMKVDVPVGTSGKTEITKPYRRVEVDRVRMIAAKCDPL